MIYFSVLESTWANMLLKVLHAMFLFPNILNMFRLCKQNFVFCWLLRNAVKFCASPSHLTLGLVQLNDLNLWIVCMWHSFGKKNKLFSSADAIYIYSICYSPEAGNDLKLITMTNADYRLLNNHQNMTNFFAILLRCQHTVSYSYMSSTFEWITQCQIGSTKLYFR